MADFGLRLMAGFGRKRTGGFRFLTGQKQTFAMEACSPTVARHAGAAQDREYEVAWASRSERLVDAAPHGHWRTTTFVAGLRGTGVVAPLVLDGPMTGAVFLAYVERVLIPALAAKPGCTVVMDNLAPHKAACVRAALDAAGVAYRYLPAYSPDLNPIEQAFSKLKAHLRKVGARTFTELFNALRDICGMFTPAECWNYFQAAGYVAG